MTDADELREFFMAMIAFLIIVEISKEPEYICEYCGRVYKQEARYNTHLRNEHAGVGAGGGAGGGAGLGAGLGAKITGVNNHENRDNAPVCNKSNDVIAEILRQNSEMLDIIRKQQETISALLRHNKILV
jgi:hypothetical protein